MGNDQSISLVPRQSGKSICWDVTVTYPLAKSHIDRTSHEAGAAVEMAALRKEDLDLGARYIFLKTTAVETLSIFNASARHVLADLGRRIFINTGEVRETSYLFQRISVLLQCSSNAVLLHDSLPAADCTD